MWTEHLEAGFCEPFQRRVERYLVRFLESTSRVDYEEYSNVHAILSARTALLGQQPSCPGLTEMEWRWELNTRAVLALVSELERDERATWTLENQNMFETLAHLREYEIRGRWDTRFFRQYVRLWQIANSGFMQETQVLGLSLEILGI